MNERQKVAGIGGVFLRATDPAALAAWYGEHLGLDIGPGFPGAIIPDEAGQQAVWSAFPADTDYFGDPTQAVMVNYRVADLDAMRAQLLAAGVRVDEKVEEMEFGRFGWAYDPEGNRFELWQPS
jgi:predicted enzyme related to lactoylglutathione lyase